MAGAGLLLALGPTAGAATSERDTRCLALIAYAEAAGEGPAGMAAVMHVVRNRTRDPRFAGDDCAVTLEPGQFQPVDESPALRAALLHPDRYAPDQVVVVRGAADRSTLAQAFALARKHAAAGADPTHGALYFVNPRLMDPGNCPWFAQRKRTATIGRHVFLTEYGPSEEHGAPGLDCSIAGIDRGRGLPVHYRIGPFAPGGPRIATRTPTRAMLEAWRRTGQLAARERELKRYFAPNWLTED
jgi:hypothetical protein